MELTAYLYLAEFMAQVWIPGCETRAFLKPKEVTSELLDYC